MELFEKRFVKFQEFRMRIFEESRHDDSILLWHIEQYLVRYRELKQQEIAREGKKKPVYETRTSLSFVDYADGHGETKETKYANWFCPTCGWFVGEQYIPRHHNQQKSNFCSRCGQQIDWDGVENEN